MNFIIAILDFLSVTVKMLLLLLVVIFLMQNSHILNITLSPLPFEIEAPASILMILFFVLGVIFGMILCSKTIIKKTIKNLSGNRELKKLQKQVAQNEKEVLKENSNQNL